MYRVMGLLAGLALALTGRIVAQETRTNPQTPEDAFSTRQLIAWSSLQKPQPAPQPLPPRDTPIPQPDQPADQQAKSPAEAQAEQSPAESFTGKIVKEGAAYVLRGTNNTTYELAEQRDLEQFEDKNVRVTGTLEAGTHRIHVVKVELLS